MYSKLVFLLWALALPAVRPQLQRKVAKFTEVYAWRQLTFDIDGVLVTQDRDDEPSPGRGKRDADDGVWDWGGKQGSSRPSRQSASSTQSSRPTTSSGTSDEGRFFIQYNNVPMGAERVGDRLFIALPRRRYGIPATLNYIELDKELTNRSPPLKPYPNLQESKRLTSVYRTRADQCGRLWMVDTGRMELPNGQRQLHTPAIVIFDLSTNAIIRRYELKPSDLPAENTPTGLASITVDITGGACEDAYAYIPDLTTFGLVVYSLRENDSWRHTHNYYAFNPVAGNLHIADQTFQWSDGVFSVVLAPGSGDCKTAYFHPLIGTHEFAVSTCVLKNRTAIGDRNYFAQYSVVGDRGEMTQSTMHDYHPASNVMFYAEIGRDAVSCWNTGEVLRSTNIGVLARDTRRMSYPSDLHVTGDEVWVMANTPQNNITPSGEEWQVHRTVIHYRHLVFTLPSANVYDIIAGTVCSRNSYPFRGGFNDTESNPDN